MPLRETALAGLAVLEIVRARVGLRVWGFDRLQRGLRRSRRSPGSGPARTDASIAAAVRRAMLRAARTVPASTCLEQAIAAVRILNARNIEAELVIGVAPGGSPASPVAAHAWVRSGDVVVAGDGDLARYTELVGGPAAQ